MNLQSLPLVGKWIEILSALANTVSILSLPLVGKWIEIPSTKKSRVNCPRVFPWWGSGLKFYIRHNHIRTNQSLPLVGKWIEIFPHC